ncbi:MAG: hypothetical protein Q8Q92_03490 [bacterium]|nr:hypothetical protein [bacterium]
MSVYDDAVRDVKELKESAMETAKNVLLEAMVPKVKEMVEQQLGETDIALEMDAVDEVAQFDETVQVDETIETEEIELEAKKKDDDDEDEEVVDEAAQVDEVVEVNESDLVEALADALKEVRSRMTSEAKVSKSFGEPKLLKTSGGSGDKGLADEKSGEHQWSGETPPAAKDWTVKEAVMKRQIASLVEKVNQYKGAYGKLLQNLKEVNLFNAKLIYTNKVLQTPGLSNKSRLAIVEQFDNARSKNDVELVYNTFTESFKIAGVMGESTKKLQRGSRVSPPSSTVLKEQMKRETQEEQTDSDDKQETLLESWERLSGVSDVLKD